MKWAVNSGLSKNQSINQVVCEMPGDSDRGVLAGTVLVEKLEQSAPRLPPSDARTDGKSSPQTPPEQGGVLSEMGQESKDCLWSAAHINVQELQAVRLALHPFRHGLADKHVLVWTDNMSVVAYINHQGGLHSPKLYRVACRLLLWAQVNLRSIRAIHLMGVSNTAVDILSSGGPDSSEWRLNHQVVEQIWKRLGRARVDLFATQAMTHCPMWFSLETGGGPLGVDAFAHPLPQELLYAFPSTATSSTDTVEDSPGRSSSSPDRPLVAETIVVCDAGTDDQRGSVAASASTGLKQRDCCTLRTNPAFLPKVESAFHINQPIVLDSFHPPPHKSDEDHRLHTLCPVWNGSTTRGRAVSKQRLAH
ncbi:uncharacterized protein LOC136764922 isoform X1 [Amia ocellicauda]|uniref:uncharacterized protein LOC136764922 isoform X1 n=1 Tax=Amia ocellicauda TaxID=2972642 RepID=UPI0034638CF9